MHLKLMALILCVSLQALACRMVCNTKTAKNEAHFFILCYEADDARYKVILDGEEVLRNLSCYFDSADKLLNRCYLDAQDESPAFVSSRTQHREVLRADGKASTRTSDVVDISLEWNGKKLHLQSDQSQKDCLTGDKHG